MVVILTKTGQSEITQPNVRAEMYTDCETDRKFAIGFVLDAD